MALGVLFVMLIVIAVLSFASIVLLFLVKDPKRSNMIFRVTLLIAGFVSYINAPASNFVIPRIVALCFGALAVIGIILNYMKKEMIAKVFVAASVVLGILQLFFF